MSFGKAEIQKGSKSFAFASFFLNRRQRHGAWLLYSFCRFADDSVDASVEPRAALKHLEAETQKALFTEEPLSEPALQGLREVVREFGIPPEYPLDLLRGMRMDVEGTQYPDLDSLKVYCYCVAGVVGLMMCHIMGVRSPAALNAAVAMGSAMQLTNICRDIRDDLALGRIYIPRQWLSEFSLDSNSFGLRTDLWMTFAERLLNDADRLYATGRAGLTGLSPASHWACAIAGEVYRRIGLKVRRRGSGAWDERCFVTLTEKLVTALQVSVSVVWRRRGLPTWKATPELPLWEGRGQTLNALKSNSKNFIEQQTEPIS